MTTWDSDNNDDLRKINKNKDGDDDEDKLW